MENLDLTRVGLIAAVGLFSFGAVQAAGSLSEQQARAKAIGMLQGDPYGATPGEVANNIRQAEFLRNGNTKACGARNRPVWEFHVVVVTPNKDQFNNGVIDGYLALDGRTGKILCTNLPMMD